jgi:hypothetical protein
MKEIIFIVIESPEGGFEANALGESIFTEADNWEELRENIVEAVSCHYDDEEKKIIRLHFVKEEILTV